MLCPFIIQSTACAAHGRFGHIESVEIFDPSAAFVANKVKDEAFSEVRWRISDILPIPMGKTC